MGTHFRRTAFLLVLAAAVAACDSAADLGQMSAASVSEVSAGTGDPGCTQEEPFTPFDTIDGDNPIVMQNGRVIELRASNKSKCAWGRISSGAPGEEVWTDRKDPAANEHEGPLGHTRIDSGTAKYTEAFKNDGKVMRACGSSQGVVECTGWF
ncbi:hypothetical protein [Lentzea terrae]|uniref:hypothetical protein n=1 Tax=Lentzea terrae TaxID=2200761 RepID=UPI000DD329A1|nr:hypothetical protein [Lentzea terrae]